MSHITDEHNGDFSHVSSAVGNGFCFENSSTRERRDGRDREGASECVCVCVRKREKEKEGWGGEREGASDCVRVCA